MLSCVPQKRNFRILGPSLLLDGKSISIRPQTNQSCYLHQVPSASSSILSCVSRIPQLDAQFRRFLGPPAGLTYDKFFCNGCFLGYPSAVGRIHITSGENILAPANFDTGFLSTCALFLMFSSYALTWNYGTERMISLSSFGHIRSQGSKLAG